MTEEHLQEDQRREAAARVGSVAWRPPGFRDRQASPFEGQAQATTIEIERDFARVSGDGRGRQTFFERGSEMDDRALRCDE